MVVRRMGVFPTCAHCGFPVEHQNKGGHLVVKCGNCQMTITYECSYDQGCENYMHRTSRARHGCYSTWKRGCRCSLCKAVVNEQQRRYRKNADKQLLREQRRRKEQRLMENMRADPDHPSHGTNYGYSAGKCRCMRCKIAASEYRAELKARRIEREAKEERKRKMKVEKVRRCRERKRCQTES